MSGVEPQLRLDPNLRRLRGSDGTPMALGGSPLRLLRLRPPADAVVDAAALQEGWTTVDRIDDEPRLGSSTRCFSGGWCIP